MVNFDGLFAFLAQNCLLLRIVIRMLSDFYCYEKKKSYWTWLQPVLAVYRRTYAKIPRRHAHPKMGPQPLTGVSNAEGEGGEVRGRQAESIEWFIEDQAFSPPYDLANFICFEINK